MTQKTTKYQTIDPDMEVNVSTLPLVDRLVEEIENHESLTCPRLRNRSKTALEKLKRAVYIIVANTPPTDTEVLTSLGNSHVAGGLSGANDPAVGADTWCKAIRALVALKLLRLSRSRTSSWALVYTRALRSRMAD